MLKANQIYDAQTEFKVQSLKSLHHHLDFLLHHKLLLPNVNSRIWEVSNIKLQSFNILTSTHGNDFIS